MDGPLLTAENSGTADTSSAPLTFEQAFAADASPASDSPDQTTTPSAAGQPTAAQEITPAPEDRSPFIPRTRFDEVNTRLKAAEQWKQQYAWAERYSPQDLQQAVDLATRASTDPIAYVQDLIAELQAHPQHGQALKSLAARALSARSSAPAPTMPDPDVAIMDAQGTVVGHTYSEQGLAARDAYLIQQVLSKVDEKYAPVVKTHESVEAERQALKDKADGQRFAEKFLSELKTYPQFEAHQKAIGEEVVRMLKQYPADDPTLNQPGFLEATTLRAYHKVVGPTLQSTAESSVLDTLQRKAHASTSVNPGSAAPSTPRKPASFYDPSLQWS